MMARRSALAAMFLFLALIFAEAGFQLRDYLDQVLAGKASGGPHAVRVLLIGDSILGLNFKDTAAGALKAELAKAGAFDVVNLSSPANNSNRVRVVIEGYMRTYAPDLVVLMLGKSDAPSSSEVSTSATLDERVTLASRIKLLRLGGLAGQKLRAWYYRMRLGAKILAAEWGGGISAKDEAALKEKFEHLDGLESRKDFPALWNELEDARTSANVYENCNAAATLALLQVRLGKGASGAEYLEEAVRCTQHLEDGKLVPGWLLSRLDALVGSAFKEAGDLPGAEVYFRKAIAATPEFSRSYSDLGWMYYNGENCALAIAPLEQALLKGTHWGRSIYALYRCYLQQQKFSEGAAFFKRLAKTSGQAPLLSLLAGLLETQTSGPSAKSPLPFKTGPANRDEYLAALWVFNRTHRPDLANALYRRLDTLNLGAGAVNQPLYREIVEHVRASGARILVLQYPNDRADEFYDGLKREVSGLETLSLRAVLLERLKSDPAKPNVSDFFESDFEHLSAGGAALLGREIAARAAAMMEAK
jgi:tetratricopeptide (TPR) repeat protein